MKSDKMSSGEVGQIKNFLWVVGIEVAGRAAPPQGGDRAVAPRTHTHGHALRCACDALPGQLLLPGVLLDGPDGVQLLLPGEAPGTGSPGC
jgi:hypothetical protein